MKTVLKITIALCLVLIASTSFAQSKEDYAKFKTVLTDLVNNWVDPVAGNEYEESNTWLPELGVRGKYFANKKTLSLLKIAEVVGEPLFVSGPHKGEPDYTAGDDFGHYNAKFLTKLNVLLAKTLKDKKFAALAKNLYNNAFKNYMRCYWRSYQRVINDKEVKTEAVAQYLALMKEAEGGDAGFEMQQYFDELAKEYEAEGLDWYEFTTTAAFWLRRSIDGTDDEFYSLLKRVMTAFDKEYMKK